MGEREGLLERVRELVEREGYELVDLNDRGAGRRRHIQVRIDVVGSTPGHGVTVDQCARVSRVLEECLDESGEAGTNYVLEVSSPGIERPVRFREHWVRFVGDEVHVKIPGRGRVKATIVRVDGHRVVLRPEQGDEVSVEIADGLKATLAVDWSQI
ncbi:MAG: ribosome maturation factor RimP [Gemmatimonadales bacterium]